MAEVMTQSKSNRASDFVEALVRMQKECNVDQLALSQWGIQEQDFERFAANARSTMGGLFAFDPHQLTDEEIIQIYKESFR